MAAPPHFPPAVAGFFPRGGPPRSPDNPNPRSSSDPLPGSPEDALLRAAFQGDLRLVKNMARVLDGGKGRGAENVRALRDSNGIGALHLGAARGMLPVCRYLVEDLGLDVNSTSEAGLTPLTCAIDAGSMDVVQYLLNNGADTETLISTGLTPLVYAVGKGNCEIVQALLCKGAYVDALTTAGAALHFAAHNGRDDIVKVLLDHHADEICASPSVITLGKECFALGEEHSANQLSAKPSLPSAERLALGKSFAECKATLGKENQP